MPSQKASEHSSVSVYNWLGATTKSCDTVDAALETPSSERILAQGLAMVLTKLEQMDRKLVQLHVELNEHREEVERIRAIHEKTFVDLLWAVDRLDDSIKKDVGRNISLLQDQSLLILAQQRACASHEQFREKWFNFTTNDNEGQGWMHTLAPSTIPTVPTTTVSATPPTTPETTTTVYTKQIPFASCKDASLKVSGVYLIKINNASSPFNVYCEQEKFEGGWIVVQHRFNGSVDFYRNWTDYRDGFGELNKEFWLGLERIHQLTTARKHEILIEMKDFEGIYKYARYNAFEISAESEGYKLKDLGSYNGTAGDSMTTYNKEGTFLTMDRDNSSSKWAVSYEGGWWYGSGGGWSNLNGRYKNSSDAKSIWWYTFKGGVQGLSFSRIMIREL
ncbi:angiopoietin-related protein 1-like [Anopheles aquasalis]|uniref:angiopoietin-related protein 1-like n=1 Tax=Anopheles aquasalis TaxID=42839 RepID=UPI00215A4CE4|nr:angiopoietin-related protein 1-like [Anopheles aquasalis]